MKNGKGEGVQNPMNQDTNSRVSQRKTIIYYWKNLWGLK